MALLKQINLADGNQASYIKISRLIAMKQNVSVLVEVYKDRDARLAGKEPSISNYRAKVTLPTPPGYSFVASSLQADMLAEAYVYLKTLAEFADAQDA